MNLDDRKMCAEFAGWTELNQWISQDRSRGGLDGTNPDGIFDDVPYYESDPAAACSLLPKLAERWHQSQHDGMSWLDFMEDLSDALFIPEGHAVCKVIVEAVRRVKP